MIFGARTIFQWRASHFLSLRQPRFFNADSIDVDASIDRGAQKRSKITTRFPIFANGNRRIFIFGARTIFAGAPVVFALHCTIVFSTPIRSMSMPRSIDVLKNDRKSRSLRVSSSAFYFSFSLHNPLHTLSLPPSHPFSSPFSLLSISLSFFPFSSRDKFESAPVTREKLV